MFSWVSFMVLVLCFSFYSVSDARHRTQSHSAAVLVGTVYCDACFHQQASKYTHFIPGAKVAVECLGDSEKESFREEVKTNKKGEFEAKLPDYFGKNLKKIRECSVRLISSSSLDCKGAGSATTQQIHFKSKKSGTRIFSAGFFSFKPGLCNQKNIKEKDFPPSVPPITGKTSPKSDKLSERKVFGFPPNPFQPPSLFPPPSIFPPLPFQPSPPSLFPPLPFQPSPPSLIPPLIPSPPPPSLFPPLPLFPPIPSLIPSPPPPPPPAFPIPLPPFPPIPGFPTVPPASTKTTP